MSIAYFIYIVLYIAVMVLIFAMSFVMLHPRTRVLFQSPVPHIHDTIGKLMIPWAITYLIYLPDIYYFINGILWRDYAYVLVSLLTLMICLSISPWSYMACLQQGVKQRILQPAILLLPMAVTVWYALEPQEWLLQAFLFIYLAEITLLICYYIRLYRAFVCDIKKYYSSFSLSMIRGLRAQWIASLFSVFVFLISMTQDTVFWGIVNMMANIFSICVLVYTSEHLMPLPQETEEAEADAAEDLTASDVAADIRVVDMSQALRDNCEERLLFCNPELSLHDLAVAIGTNRTYLSKWFADHDTTFYNYINKLRIEYAAHLLLTTDDSVKKIQTAAGFASKTTFQKYFHDYFDCSPSEYRKTDADSLS